MADWARLDHDLLIEIAERLPSMESYKSFGAVCRSWAAAATKGHLNQTTFEVPWLMLAEKEGEKKQDSSECEFTSVSLGSKMTGKIFLPEAGKKRCLSCKDWLFIVDQDEIHASLLHPLSRLQTLLPKLNTFSLYASIFSYHLHFIEKVVLSANPTTSTSDCIVMVIWGRCCQLAFCKPGDTSWTPIDNWIAQFSDIVYCNNKLYGLDRESRVLTCDIHGPNPTQLHQVFFAIPPEIVEKSYLVEFSGKFLIVHRYIDIQEASYKTEEFKVFEVDIEDGTWVEVKDLGNRALFLGYNSSFSIECSEFNNCKANCIYFSDDSMELYLSPLIEGCTEGGKDMGIYHLWDGSVGPLFDHEIVCSTFAPPTWIGPSF